MATRYCSINGKYLNVDQGIELKPGEANNITESIVPRHRNTFICLFELEEKRTILDLFDTNDGRICYRINEECVWKIQEDGLCMFSEGICVLTFRWDELKSEKYYLEENSLVNNDMKL